MASLRTGLALLLLALPGPTRADVGRWHAEIAEASARFGVPADWIRRVMQAESGGRTHLAGRPITSHAGAMGLMQLMPGTWAELRARYGLGNDPFEPRANILGGAVYLRMMHDRFGYPGMFAAYNAGPARYAAYLAGRASLPRETRNYLASTAGIGSRRSPATQAQSTPHKAVADIEPRPQSAALSPPDQRAMLFAIDRSEE